LSARRTDGSPRRRSRTWLEVEDLIAVDDKAVARVTATANHDGEFDHRAEEAFYAS